MTFDNPNTFYWLLYYILYYSTTYSKWRISLSTLCLIDAIDCNSDPLIVLSSEYYTRLILHIPQLCSIHLPAIKASLWAKKIYANDINKHYYVRYARRKRENLSLEFSARIGV